MDFDIFNYSFMHRALWAGALVAIPCSLLGVFVVLRGMSFIGAGISHAAFAGVAIGLSLGLPPLFVSVIFCTVISLIIGVISKSGRIKEETSIGVFFAATMALGVLLVGLLKDPSIDIMSYLFGGIFTLSSADISTCIILSLFVLVVLLLFYKEFVEVVFDEELSYATGFAADKLIYLLMILLALTVVISMTVVGAILVSALIVTPAAAALQISKDINRVSLIAVSLGLISTEFGILLSYYFNTAPGPTIVLLLTLVFLLALVARILSTRRGSTEKSAVS